MKSFPTILVGTDFSPLGEAAVASALKLAVATGARRVHVVHVINSATAATLFPYSVPEAQLAHALRRSVEDAQARLDALDFSAHDVPVTRAARLGPPGKELADEADKVGADLIVAASHGYGPFRRTLVGSVTGALIRTAHCPVLIVGADRMCSPPFKKVLAAVDLSRVTKDILTNAVGLTCDQGHLDVLSLFEHPLVNYDGAEMLPRYVTDAEVAEMSKGHAAAVQALVDDIPHPGVRVNIEAMSKAPAAQVVLDAAEMQAPDLLVIGTSGHNAWHRMILGSTATRVISEAHVPVLVVPHPDQVADGAPEA